MRKIIILLLLLSANSFASPRMLSLDEAIRIGLENNYDILIARNQAEIANNNKGLGTAGLLPTLGVSGTYSKGTADLESNLPPVDGSTDMDNLSGSLTLNWVVFDGFKMFVDRSRYNELAMLNSYQTKNSIENKVVEISQSYFGLVLQEELYKIAKTTYEISQTRFEREKIRNDIGGASSSDLLNAQVAFNLDRSNLLNQELEESLARDKLNVLLGWDPWNELAVYSGISLDELNFDYKQLLEKAIENNATLKTAEYSKQVAERGVSLKRSAFMPKLSLFASLGYDDQTRNSNYGDFSGLDATSTTNSSTVGAQLSFNLFNGRRDKIALQNAKIEANNQNLMLLDLKNRLTSLVREVYDTYKQRKEIVLLEEENIKAAEANLNIQQEQFELGATNSLKFRDAQVSFNRSQTALITARYQAKIAYINLEKLIGILKIDL